MFGGKQPNYMKLKTNLRLAINRLKLLEKKKTELALKARREISEYIAAGKEDRARIRVEHIVREDYLVEGMEIIEMYCDLLQTRFGMIQKMKELDPGIEEAIATIIWAAPRLWADVQELKIISDNLTLKYGKEFAEQARVNGLENVNEKVMHKLAITAPPKVLIERYMEEIAKAFNVPFEPDDTILREHETTADDLIDLDLNEKKGGGGGASGGGGMMFPQVPSAPQSHPPMNPEKPPMPSDPMMPMVPTHPGPPPGSDLYPPSHHGHPAGSDMYGPGLAYPGGMPLPPPPSQPNGSQPPGYSEKPSNGQPGYASHGAPPFTYPNVPGLGQTPPHQPAGRLDSLPPYDAIAGNHQPYSQPGPTQPPSGSEASSNTPPIPPGSTPSNTATPPPKPPRVLPSNTADPGFTLDLPSVPPAAGNGALTPGGSHLNLPDLSGLPDVPAGGASVGGDDIDFDDLSRRFEQLKKKK